MEKNTYKSTKKGQNAKVVAAKQGKSPSVKPGKSGQTRNSAPPALPKKQNAAKQSRAPRYPDYPAPGEVEEFPHFRKYKKSNHPALIVSEHSKEEYNFKKIMHGTKDGNQTNEKIVPNPNPKDPNPMYLGKRLRHDKKSLFSRWKYPWRLPKKKK